MIYSGVFYVISNSNYVYLKKKSPIFSEFKINIFVKASSRIASVLTKQICIVIEGKNTHIH